MRALKRLSKEFVNTTSLQPIAEIKVAPYFVFKIAWIIAFIIASYFMVEYMHNLTVKYRKYSINTNVNQVSKELLPFPSVTICNLNNLKKDKLVCSPYRNLITLDDREVKPTKCDDDEENGILGIIGDTNVLDSDTGCDNIRPNNEYYGSGSGYPSGSFSGFGSGSNGGYYGSGSGYSGDTGTDLSGSGSGYGIGSNSDLFGSSTDDSADTGTYLSGSGTGYASGSNSDLFGSSTDDSADTDTDLSGSDSGHGSGSNSDLYGSSTDDSGDTGTDLSGSDSSYGSRSNSDLFGSSTDDSGDTGTDLSGSDSSYGSGSNSDLYGSSTDDSGDTGTDLSGSDSSYGSGSNSDLFGSSTDDSGDTGTDLSGSDRGFGSGSNGGYYGSGSGYSGDTGTDLSGSDRGSGSGSNSGHYGGRVGYSGNYFMGSGYVFGSGADYYTYESIDCKAMSEIKTKIGNATVDNIFEVILNSSKTGDLTDVKSFFTIPHQHSLQYGYTKEEMIVQCSFDRKSCDHTSFTKFYSTHYSNCYTFNTNISQTQTGIHITRQYGSQNGLRLLLNVNASQYLGYFTAEYGARITINSPDYIPRPEITGVNVAPGTKVTIGIKADFVHRKSHPYKSNCTHTLPYKLPIQQTTFPSKAGYTIEDCRAACFQVKLYDCCQCVFEDNSFGEKNSSNQTYSTFNPFNSTHFACKDSIDQGFNNISKGGFCNCPPACESLDFSQVVYTTGFPCNQHLHTLFNHFLSNSTFLPGVAADMFEEMRENKDEEYGFTLAKNFMQDNIISVQIYYETLTITEWTEEPAYSFSELFADIGGTMGIYMGLTIMTIIEMVQFLITQFCHCCSRYH